LLFVKARYRAEILLQFALHGTRVQGDIDPAVREAILCIIQSKKADHSQVF